MLSKRVIPCLDVHNGRTVKGINFVDLIDAGDPVEQAKLYNDLGADEICFLDISATNEGRKTLFNIVSKVAESCFIPLTVGGGIKNNVDINNLLKSGADKVSINSAAVFKPNLIKEASDKNDLSATLKLLEILKKPRKYSDELKEFQKPSKKNEKYVTYCGT